MWSRARLFTALLATLALLAVARAQPPARVYLPALAQPPTLTATSAAPAPTAPPGPTATPEPERFASCATVRDPARAPNVPVRIAAIDKRAETVTLENVSAAAVSLDGWRMCSLAGGQQHPIGGTLAPGESRTFPGPAASIWNNSTSDPGALWDAAGSLVSYWPD